MKQALFGTVLSLVPTIAFARGGFANTGPFELFFEVLFVVIVIAIFMRK